MFGLHEEVTKLRARRRRHSTACLAWLDAHRVAGTAPKIYRTDHMHRNMVTLAKVPMRPVLEHARSEYFRTNIAITTSGVNWHEALLFAQRTVGADNIMFAIDYPYERTEEAVRFIRTAPLDPVDLAKITHRNAERIFGIGHP